MPIITGTTGPDVLTGTPFSDEIDGLGGNDLIEGGQDSDTLNGGDGNDYLNHNTRTPYTFDDFAPDTLNGGNGNDVIDIGLFDVADGGDGIDRVTSYQSWRFTGGVDWDLSGVADIRSWFNSTFGVGASNFEQYGLAAGDGNDVIIGFDQDVIGGPASTLEGLGGNDRLEGRGGRDELYGGTGNDILRGDDGDDLLDGGEGHDDIQGGAGFDTLGVTTVGTDAGHFTIDLTITGAQDTGAGIDTISGVEFITVRTANASQTYGLYGDGGLNVLTGGLGDDILDGRDGNDVLRGGAGADLIVGGNGADEAGYNGSDAGVTINLLTNVVSGGHAQGDTLISIENLSGSEFVDDLTGDMGANRLQGNGGNDVLTGLAGVDVLIGGMGADILEGGDDNDTLWGGDGRETSADNAVDTLNGGGGNDNITLGEGDIGDGGVGGFDQAFVGFYGRTSGIVLDLSGGTEAAVEAAGGFQLTNFEAFHVTGTAHDDVITGSAVGEQLNGGEGNDHLIGGGGLDTLLGGLGNDVLDGGVANDQLRGGAGDDVYILDDTGDAVFENLNEGTDEVRTGFATYTLGANVENLTFSGTGAHTGVGNALDNVLTGNDGDDVMTGGLGSDEIHGGGGGDTAVFAGPRSAWSVAYVPGGVLVSNAAESNFLTGVEFLAFADGTVPVATPVEIVGTEDGETLSGDVETPVIEIIRGLGGSDTLYGFGGGDTLYGGGEGDQLSGGDGDDTVYGETGYDTLFGGAGADVLDGGSEGDTLDGGEGDDRLYGGAGDDNLAPGAGVDYVDGGAGEDNIYFGGDAAVVINLATGVHGGGAAGETFISVERFVLTEGDDEATGASTSERFIGGGGNDILRSGGGGGFLFGGEGNDTLIGGEGGGEEYLQGDAGDDTIHGGGGTDYLFADRGDDILDGGDGDDTLDFQSYGGLVTVDLRITGSQYISDVDGSDTLSNIENLVGETFNRVYHFTGDDSLNRLSGSNLDDILNGMGGNDSINGGEGADQLDGGDGNDNLYSGSGDDTALGGVGNDNLSGEGGADTLDGGEGDDYVYAGDDNDVARGGAGIDVLYGQAGDDILSGGAGDDTMDGGDGIDTAAYLSAAGGVVASLATGGASNDGDGGTDTFSSIENLTGSAFADVLTGDGGANVLSGAAGNDQLLGGDGDDVLRGGAGVDVLAGGLGNDTADYSTAAAGMRAQLNANASTNDGDGGTDTFSGIENLTGSAFNDTLIGDGNVNVLRGGTGADTLLGLGGNDVLWGGAGALNTLQGGLGDDTYVLEAADSIVENVGEGADTVDARIAVYTLANNIENLVFGGTGNFTGTGNALNNVITGGAGDDNLRGRGGVDVLNGGDGVDTVDYTLAAAGVTARLDLNRATNDGDGATDTFTGIENLTGSNFNDLLIGNGGNNVLMGGIGTDTLLGFGGDDVLMGGSGGGNNQLQGGQGNDWYILDAFDTCVEVAGEGVDTVEARVGSYTLGNNIENLLYTGPGKFVGSGNALDNHITGWTQNDILRGGGGDDVIDGGGGSDEVQFRGSKAQYTVTVEGEGYRIVDSVAGRDGSTFVTSIEVLRFITGNTTTALSYPPPSPAPLETDKDTGPLTSPIGHDDFLLSASHDRPEVLPAVHDKVLEDGPQVLPGVEESKAELRELFALHHGPHALYLQPEPDFATTDHHRDWM